MSDSTLPLRDRLWRLSALAVLLVLTAFVFLPSLHGELLNWDDQENLSRHTQWRGLSWVHLRWMATATVMGHYIPLTWLTFAVDHAVWGMNPWGFHLTNVLLHVGATAVFFMVVVRLLSRAMAPTPTGATLGAALAASFFALHPLRTESVAWITERRDVLSGCLVLVATLAYLAAQDRPGRRRRWLLAASIAAYTGAMASKSIVMGFPIVLFALDVYPLRRLALDRVRDAGAVLREKIPYVVVAIAGATTAYFVVNTVKVTPIEQFPWSGRFAMVFYTFWFYLSRTVLPVNLSPLYELPAQVLFWMPRFLLPTLFVLALTGTLLALRRRWPAALVAWVCYLTFLAPISGIVHAGFQLAHDRYSYLSCLGFATLVGAAAAALWDRRLVTVGASMRAAALGVMMAWIVALGWLTSHQVPVWRDERTLWTHAVDSDPGCAICRTNLAVYYVNNDDLAAAVHQAHRAIILRPDRPKPLLTLLLAHIKANDFDRAIVYGTRYLRHDPRNVEALTGIGVAHLRAGRPGEAVSWFLRAMTIDPRYLLARVNLADALLRQGHREAALAAYREALTMEPESGEARYGVGLVLAHTGDFEGAREAHRILEQQNAVLAARLAHEITAAR